MSIELSNLPLETTHRSALRHIAFLLDRGIDLVTESIDAAIVVAETCSLNAHSPSSTGNGLVQHVFPSQARV